MTYFGKMKWCVVCGKERHDDAEGLEAHCPELGMHFEDKFPDISLKELSFID
jgi:NADH pyrophosphatase NudC (nudix superfamily)